MRHLLPFTRSSMLLLASSVLLAACGGGGSSGSFAGSSLTLWEQRTAQSDKIAAICAVPRTGVDPFNNNRPYPDRSGTLADERNAGARPYFIQMKGIARISGRISSIEAPVVPITLASTAPMASSPVFSPGLP